MKIDKMTALKKIVELIPDALYAIRTQNILAKAGIMDELLKNIEETVAYIPNVVKEQFNEIVKTLVTPMESGDNVLLADYLENLVKPFFVRLLENEVGLADDKDARIIINEELLVELTSSGDYTMLFRNIYFHSNIFPQNEAEELVKYWDDPMEKTCFVWGLGLGYHVLKMLEMDLYRNIKVFEPEKIVINMAEEYGVLEQIMASERADIIYDPKGENCAEHLRVQGGNENALSRLLVFYPTLDVMPDSPLKASLKKYYAHFVSVNNQKRSLYMSFRENSALNYKGLHELRFNNKAKRAIIVSAGPSLDKNYRELKKRKEDTVVIATAPTMRKLYKDGIIPDCTVICDTKEKLKKLHEGAEDAECPLVFSSTASVPFVNDHKGPRYMLCQKGFEPAVELAKQKGWLTYDSYGSVALTALVVAIEKGFKEIVFIGQALCYKGNLMHASDTSQHFADRDSDRKESVDIFGEAVSVPTNLQIFKDQIENIIRKNPQIKFLNATEGGVHIDGAEDIKLLDIL